MLNHIFYHSLLRQYSIAYGPKRKWVVAQAQDPTTVKVAVQYPRVAFYFNNMTLDKERQINPTHRFAHVVLGQDDVRYSGYVPVPYKLDMEVACVAKNMDDLAQMAEQIFPFFTPDLTQSAKLVPSLDRVWDIVFRLKSNQLEDVYDGQFTKRQVLIWTFNFEVDVWFFGPVTKQGVIKRVQVDLTPVPGDGPVTNLDTYKYGRIVRIETTPGLTADGKPTSKKSESIDWHAISKDDPYGFCDEISDFFDGKKYDPVSGTDKKIPTYSANTSFELSHGIDNNG